MDPILCTTEDVEALVEDIVVKHNLKNVLDIKYSTGTDVAHGFLSKTVAVDIITQNEKETIHLWLKFVSDHNHFSKLPLEKLYQNEIYFYDTIYPAYTKFFDEKGVKDGFQNTAKCYGSLPKGMLALDNLKYQGFQCFDKNEEATIDKHIEHVLRAYAKFHAVGFAFKDQKKDEYETFRRIVFDFYENSIKTAGIVGNVKYTLEEFFRQLRPVEDRKILNKFDVGTLIKHITDPQVYVTENAVLTQGDCWFNNAMFLYEVSTTYNKHSKLYCTHLNFPTGRNEKYTGRKINRLADDQICFTNIRPLLLFLPNFYPRNLGEFPEILRYLLRRIIKANPQFGQRS